MSECAVTGSTAQQQAADEYEAALEAAAQEAAAAHKALQKAAEDVNSKDVLLGVCSYCDEDVLSSQLRVEQCGGNHCLFLLAAVCFF